MSRALSEPQNGDFRQKEAKWRIYFSSHRIKEKRLNIGSNNWPTPNPDSCDLQAGGGGWQGERGTFLSVLLILNLSLTVKINEALWNCKVTAPVTSQSAANDQIRAGLRWSVCVQCVLYGCFTSVSECTRRPSLPLLNINSADEVSVNHLCENMF